MELQSKNKQDIFKICTVFLICGFIGWVFETIALGISKHIFTNRGDLFVLEPLKHYFPFLQNVPLLNKIPLIVGLPIIEIYGLGGVLAIFGFRKLANKPVILFFTGMAVLTFFELIGSYFCTYILHKNFWDYSDRFLNFQGRICLLSSIAWGVASFLAVKAVSPMINRIYRKVRRRRVFKVCICLLMCGVLICACAKYWWFPDILAK